MSTISNGSSAGASVLFLARMQAAMEAMEVESAKADIEDATSSQKEIRAEIKTHEGDLAEKQRKLDGHLDRGPHIFQKVTGLGNHDQVTNKKKDDIEITENEIKKEEALLKREREEINSALDTVREALGASANVRRDIESLLEDQSRVSQRIMRG